MPIDKNHPQTTIKTPFELSCSNYGFTDRWSCPACYNFLGDVGNGNKITCKECGNTIKCTFRTIPDCFSEVDNADP